MAVQLTEGAIAMICTGQWEPADVQPVLQVTDLRIVSTQNSSSGKVDRYRLMLSDGTFSQQGMLATQQNDLVRCNQMQKGSIVRLKDYLRNMIQERMYFVSKLDFLMCGGFNVETVTNLIYSLVVLDQCYCNIHTSLSITFINHCLKFVWHPFISFFSILIIINIEVIVPFCEPIGQPKAFPVRSSSEPPSPIQAFNQPAITSTTPQTFMGHNSFPRPANSPIYPPNQEHNTAFHSYGNNPMSPHSIPSFSRSPTTTTTYIRPVQPQSPYNQPLPMYTNTGPTSKTEPPARIMPISQLNPYQGRWTIKARVTSKTELRHYNNAKGDGKVFSFDLLDSEGTEIRVTCFNTVADQFYNQVETGKVYFLSKGTVKPASKAFNHLKNEHEILLDNNSTIQTCFEDDTSIPHQQFHFRPIAEIEGMENNSVLDVIGVVSSITPTGTITRKNGTETQKRTLQLKDMSGKSVEVTLWGNFCSTEGQTLQHMCDSGVFPVLALKSARVSDFNGKSIGTISTSQLCIEPDFPEGKRLKTWFDNIGRNSPSVSLSITTRPDSRKTLSQIIDEKLGFSEKPDWITVNATIMNVRLENFCYTACPITIGDRKCSKKVTDTGDGKWRCDRCDQSVDECDYRYILSVNIMDHTGSIWVTAFQESGEEITGVSAKELHFMKYEEGDEEKFTGTIRNVLHSRFNFKLKVKEESYNDESRVKSTVVKAEKVKPSNDTCYYLEYLKKEVNPGFMAPKVEIPVPSNTGFLGQQVSQYGNQYGGSRVGSISSICNSCGGVGHNSANCPSVGSGQGYTQGGRFDSGVSYGGGNTSGSGGGGGGGECYKCHESGHWAKDCPTRGGGGGGGNVGQGRYGSVPGQYVGGY
ncbi:hypothetical protein LXL04_025889 [Taraxacum kok-saghyz]